MAVMNDADRAEVSTLYQSDVSLLRELLANMTKHDIRAAVNAADVWADANAASFNSALPAVARTNMTANQKARLLKYVIDRRYSTGG